MSNTMFHACILRLKYQIICNLYSDVGNVLRRENRCKQSAWGCPVLNKHHSIYTRIRAVDKKIEKFSTYKEI